jgi:hypothetical protein
MSRVVIRAAGAVILATLLLGSSARADAPAPHAPHAVGHTSNEWLMMGRMCGASISPT